jgi:3-dehydroquinate synthase
LRTLDLGRDAVVVTHPCLLEMHGRSLCAGLRKNGFSVKVMTMPEGERSKSSQQVFRLINELVAYDIKKKPFIVAFGGGVVGDLAGFVAAVYKRGIPYIQVPTTFLAQIDSAIGGKVAVDLPAGKNLVGAFYQPRLVFSDVGLLSTLGRRQIKNGLAEAIKYGIICDPLLFNYIEQNAKSLLAADPKVLREVVFHCSRIKARIVMNDEKETRGMRTILNFGHTIGHAIEAANRFRYYHGEAVALGMRVATEMSCKLKLISAQDAARIQKALSTLQLPERFDKIVVRKILQAMRHDKKFQGKKNRFVLVTGIGSVKVVEDVPPRTIQAALRAFQPKR